MRILIGLLLFLALSAQATTNRNSGWLGTFAKKKLTDKYSYWIEAQNRYRFDLGKTGQFLYRTGLIQKITDKQSLAYLYAWIKTGAVSEHRWTLQHGMKYGQAFGFHFGHRARLEYRNLEDNSQDATRARYLIRAEQKTDKKFDFVVWDEVFVNLKETSWNGNQALDRNRLFIGFKYPYLTGNRVEFGYLNQYVPRDAGDTSEHVLVGYLFF